MIDADGSMDPGEIARYVEALVAGADFVKGSRFMEGGEAPTSRGPAGWGTLLQRFTNLLYRCHYTDLCYGYNAFWAHCLPVITSTGNGFEVETLINIRIAKAGLTVAEVPASRPTVSTERATSGRFATVSGCSSRFSANGDTSTPPPSEGIGEPGERSIPSPAKAPRRPGPSSLGAELRGSP